MKKLLTVSLVAMMAVTTARAEIASKAYVDQQDGQLSTLKTTAKTNLVAAINELSDKAGETSVADQIAAALVPYTETGEDTNYVSTVSSDGEGNVVSAVSGNVNGTVTVTKGITALTASDIDQTYDGTSSNAQSGTAVAQAITAAGGQTAQQVATAIDTKVGTLDGNVTGTGNVVTTISEADGIVTATVGNALDKVGTASGDGNVITAISKNADNQTIDVVKGITALTASDIAQTYDGTSSAAMSGKAVAAAITDAGGQTAQQVATAIDTKVGTLDGSVTGDGNAVVTLSQADGVITGTKGNVLDKVAASGSGNGNVITAISENSDGQTIDYTMGITAQEVDNMVTATTGTDYTSNASSTTKYPSMATAAQIAADAASSGASTALNNLNLTSAQASGTGVVTEVTQTNGQIAVTKSQVTNSEVASDAAIAMSKIAMPTTLGTDGVYALTGILDNGNITYKWELIQRATSGNGGE